MNIYFDKDYNLLITKEEQEDKTNFVYVDVNERKIIFSF